MRSLFVPFRIASQPTSRARSSQGCNSTDGRARSRTKATAAGFRWYEVLRLSKPVRPAELRSVILAKVLESRGDSRTPARQRPLGVEAERTATPFRSIHYEILSTEPERAPPASDIDERRSLGTLGRTDVSQAGTVLIWQCVGTYRKPILTSRVPMHSRRDEMRGADMVEILIGYGVETIFGVPADTNVPLYEALQGREDKIRHAPRRTVRGLHGRRLCPVHQQARSV